MIQINAHRGSTIPLAKPDQTAQLKENIKPDAEKQKLYKAAKEMESLFLYHMLQAMRKTVPEGNKLTGGFGDNLGKDVYTQIFDQELAMNVAGSNNKSLADLLYNSMEKAVERQNAGNDEAAVQIRDIIPQTNQINLKSADKISNVKPDSQNEVEKNSPIREDFGELIDKAAQKYDLSPRLIESVIKAESNGDPRVVSHAGAKGLMQLTDTTATEMGVNDSFDPGQNIDGGAGYLRRMLDRFSDLKEALAAYNAGPGTVEKYGGIPPYGETTSYIEKVTADFYED
jgi:Rod binding domain-containing protein